MAYVTVPKDLTKVKNKVAFNLTKRQLICFGIGAALGVPTYFLTRNVLGTSNAATLMMLVMLPAFVFAMYEKDGMHLEQILQNIINVKFLHPAIRRYETVNLYEAELPKRKSAGGRNSKKISKKVSKKKGGTTRGRKQR